MPNSPEARKFGVTGAPCSGKSTVIRDFAETIPGAVAYAEEQARLYLKGIPPPDRAQLGPQKFLADKIMAAETEAANSGLPVLCDRSVADGLAYLRLAGKEAEAEEYFEYIRFWLPTYEKFILCSPAGIPYENDEVRTEPSEFRDALHQELLDTFELYGIKYELLEGSREERHARIAELARPGQE